MQALSPTRAMPPLSSVRSHVATPANLRSLTRRSSPSAPSACDLKSQSTASFGPRCSSRPCSVGITRTTTLRICPNWQHSTMNWPCCARSTKWILKTSGMPNQTLITSLARSSPRTSKQSLINYWSNMLEFGCWEATDFTIRYSP